MISHKLQDIFRNVDFKAMLKEITYNWCRDLMYVYEAQYNSINDQTIYNHKKPHLWCIIFSLN